MNRKSILTLAVLAAFAIGAPVSSFAKPKEKAAAAGEKAATESKPVPYHGKVASVDATAKTFTIKGKEKDRVFSITDKTTITKDGAAADISAITAGEEVRGQAIKSGDNWEAVKVMLGAKEPKAGKEAKDTKKKDEAKPAADAKPDAAAPAAPAPAAPAAPADAAPKQ